MRFITFTLACLCILLSINLSGQTTIGFRVLAGSSALTSSNDALPSDLGWHDRGASTSFGLVTETALTRSLSIRSGIQQTQRGTTLRSGTALNLLGTVVPYDFDAEVRMNYLEVPLAVKLRMPIAGYRLSLYGWAGVTAGYALTGSVKSRSVVSPNSVLATTKLAMDDYLFSRYHFGYNGGLGLGYNLGQTMQFRLEAEYNRSIEEKGMLSTDSG